MTAGARRLDPSHPAAHSAPASHSVDQFMTRLEIESGAARSATSVARETASHTRRWSAQLNDDLDATIDSIVDDLVATNARRAARNSMRAWRLTAGPEHRSADRQLLRSISIRSVRRAAHGRTMFHRAT